MRVICFFFYARRSLGISLQALAKWTKSFKDGQYDSVPSHVARKSKKSCNFPVQERDLHDWVKEQLALGMPVHSRLIREKMLELVKSAGLESSTFKASTTWYTGWKRRFRWFIHWFDHFRSWRQVTSSKPQSTAAQLEEMKKCFAEISEFISQHGAENVVNMDETAVFFDLGQHQTLAATGAKEVRSRVTGSKMRVTAVFTIGAGLNAKAVPPFVILKSTAKRPRPVATPRGLFATFQKHAWMDEQRMLFYLNNVLPKLPSCKALQPTMLVLDNFRGHKTPAVLEKMKSINVTPMFLPPSTSHLSQPLDGGPNRSFKSNMRRQWINYFLSGPKQKSNHFKTPTRETLLQWVKNSWDNVSVETIQYV